MHGFENQFRMLVNNIADIQTKMKFQKSKLTRAKRLKYETNCSALE